jgi:hypothetical protein
MDVAYEALGRASDVASETSVLLVMDECSNPLQEFQVQSQSSS